MNKENVLKRIRELEEKYNYWFEVFRRSTDRNEKEEAKRNYKAAFEENIYLQDKYGLGIPPRHSSGERAEMRIERGTGTLALSELQLKEQRTSEEFDKEKKILDDKIAKELLERKLEFIRDILEKMLLAGFLTEQKCITATLDSVDFYKPNPKLSTENKIKLLLPVFVLGFEPFLSGALFIKELDGAYREAVEAYASQHPDKSEELFEGCLKMLGKAAEASVLRAGKSYFEARAERLKLNWGAAKETIKAQADYVTRQNEIRDKVLGLIANNSGILQTGIYKLLGAYKKEEIGGVLYFLSKEKRITREKEGNTYKLYSRVSLIK